MLNKLLGLDPSQEIDKWDLAFRGGSLLGLLLIVAAILFAIFLYRGEQLVTNRRRITMIALQGAALLTLILVLMQPYARIKMSKESKSSMIVMLDTSRSMSIEDPRTSAEDVEEAAKVLGKRALDAPALGLCDQLPEAGPPRLRVLRLWRSAGARGAAEGKAAQEGKDPAC